MPEIAEAQALLERWAHGGERRGPTEADPLTADGAPPGTEQNSLFVGCRFRSASFQRPLRVATCGTVRAPKDRFGR
jgi:hypothetical protein